MIARPTSHAVVVLDAKSFEAQVQHGIVLVGFSEPWCGQCQILAPSLETLAGQLEGQLRIVEVNLDDRPEVAGEYGISQVPTLILFENGVPIECYDALTSPEELKVRLQGVLADYSAPVSGR
jgi:thioredoxin 1